MAERTLMEEVNEALENGGVVSPSDEELEGAELEGAELEADDAEGDDAVGDDEGEGDESLEDDGGEPPAGYERDAATGRFTKKAPEVEAAKPKEGEAAKPKVEVDPATGKPKVEAKKPDALNDPIDKTLKAPTQERIRTLITTAKEATAAREKAETDFNFLVQGVQSTGASPEQYGETLSWLALFNSQDPTQQGKALELAETVCDRLATLLGRERTVGDPLAEHADLKDAVAKGHVTAQYAKEIARTRNSQSFRGQLNDNAATEARNVAAREAELTTARNDLTDLEATLASTDPNWAQHKQILVAALKPVFAALPPKEWKAKFTEAYRQIRAQNLPVARKAKIPANQSMRPGRSAGGGGAGVKPQHGSALDAMNDALAGM